MNDLAPLLPLGSSAFSAPEQTETLGALGALGGPSLDLRDYQEEAISLLRASLASGHKRPVLHLATGSGKTLCAAAITRAALARGKRVIFTVPALSLIDQAVQMFARANITEVGVIQANHFMTDYAKPVQVASVQTLARRNYPACDLVIVDECHVIHKTILRWMALKPDLPFIGLSATPYTRGLGKYYDDLIRPRSMQELIDGQVLCPYRIWAPSHPDLSDVKIVAGDFHEGQLSAAMQKRELVGDVICTWLERAGGQPTLVFAVDRAHAKVLQERFLAEGVPAGYIDMNTSRQEREEIRKQFHDGRLKVVCSVATLSMGIDWDVRAISYCRPTRSKALYIQQIGRGLRTADGKTHCKILDHSDTALTLGFPADIDACFDALHDGRPRTKGPAVPQQRLPKPCPRCGALRAPSQLKCDACGFVVAPQPNVQTREGELVEMVNRHKARDHYYTPQEKQNWYRELRWIAAERNYKPGWAFVQYIKKFKGDKPPWAWNSLSPIPATPAVRSWETSRRIAYAEGMKKYRPLVTWAEGKEAEQ